MTLGEAVSRPRQRLTMTNMATAESVTFQFNPEEVAGQLEARYSRKNVQGFSHQPLQYGGTGNRKFSFALFFLSFGSAETARNISAKNFLESLLYVSATQRSPSAAPPKVLLSWPNFISMTVKITTISDRYFRFDRDGKPVGFEWQISVEEQLERRITSEQVRAVGIIRASQMRREET